MKKTILGTGVVFGGTAILLGAFGAHGLEKHLTPDAIQTFETGVSYQMYHALFLLWLGIMPVLSEKEKKLPFYLITIGVLLFSLSIYLLATNSLTAFNFKNIAFLTPIGGTFLILAWVFCGVLIFRSKAYN